MLGPVTHNRVVGRPNNTRVKDLAETGDKQPERQPLVLVKKTEEESPEETILTEETPEAVTGQVEKVFRWETDEFGALKHFDVLV